MSDLVITTANVRIAGPGATCKVVQVGEDVSEGQPGYPLQGKYYLADASAMASAKAKGIFQTSAAANGWAVLQTGGPIDLGTTLAKGETYSVSATKGMICPVSDIGAGECAAILGIADSNASMPLKIQPPGAIKP